MQKYVLWLMLLPLMVSAQSADDELVKVKAFIPDIVLDLKYNTPNNFAGQKLYSTDECFLALKVVKRLKLVQDSLRLIRQHDGNSYPQGLGLKIWDGYRPRAVQYLMWEILPDPTFVADPATGSSHNRGAAVDVTLVDRATGKELGMPTYFDDFSERASHSYSNLPANILANRELLESIMVDVGGFVIYAAEWWHYSLPAAAEFPLLDFQLK
jgi:zinc D-Ala-D-Ala dipeptidase